MYLEALKQGQLSPYIGPGLPDGAGGTAPVQPGNIVGPTPFGMGQYPPPEENFQVPVDVQPMEEPGFDPSLPPNPTGLSGMDAMYGPAPAAPDYGAYDAETEEMARQVKKQGMYEMLMRAGMGFLNAGGNFGTGMAQASAAIAGMPNSALAAQAMRQERAQTRRDMESGFLANRKNYYQGVQEQQKAEYIDEAGGYGAVGASGSVFGAGGTGPGVAGVGPGGITRSQAYDDQAFRYVINKVPEEHIENVMAQYAMGGLDAVHDYANKHGWWGGNLADPHEGIQQLGKGGVLFDLYSNAYMIPSLRGNKWIMAQDILIPDPSALAQDEAMMNQARLEIQVANMLRRVGTGEATPDEKAELVAGLSDEQNSFLIGVVENMMGGGGAKIPPDVLQEMVTTWLQNAGYTSNLQRTGGLLINPTAVTYGTQMDARKARMNPSGVQTTVTPGTPAPAAAGQDQGWEQQGGYTFAPGQLDDLDILVEQAGGPQAKYDELMAAGQFTPDGKKQIDRVFGDRYGVGPLAPKETTTGAPHYAHGKAPPHEYRGTLDDPAGAPVSDRLAADADRIAAEAFSLPPVKEEPIEYEVTETGGFKRPSENVYDPAKAVGGFLREAGRQPVMSPERMKAQRKELLSTVSRGLTFADRKRLREHVADMSDEQAIEELKRLKEQRGIR
jgi:hypothetical protein